MIYKLDIEKEKIKIPCPNCQKNTIVTYRTESCPVCNMQFNTDYIHSFFHDYETRLMNNKAYSAGEKISEFGNAAKNVGNGLSKIGRAMTLLITIPILIILALLL